jgi:hypothetical protein
MTPRATEHGQHMYKVWSGHQKPTFLPLNLLSHSGYCPVLGRLLVPYITARMSASVCRWLNMGCWSVGPFCSRACAWRDVRYAIRSVLSNCVLSNLLRITQYSLTGFAYCVLRIAYHGTRFEQHCVLRIAYCVWAYPLGTTLARIAYCVLRIAYWR